LLALIHAYLYTRFPELSLVFVGERPLWMRWFIFIEGCVVLLATVVVVSYIVEAITAGTVRKPDRVGLVLYVILMAAVVWLRLQ
jgi:hypothetical protein